jgi:hypothetical protein
MDAQNAKHRYMGQENPDTEPSSAIVDLFDLVIDLVRAVNTLQVEVREIQADNARYIRALEMVFDELAAKS